MSAESVLQTLEGLITMVRQNNDEDHASKLDQARLQVQQMVYDTGNPALVEGMLINIYIYYAMDVNMGAEAIDNLYSVRGKRSDTLPSTHPGEVLNTMRGTYQVTSDAYRQKVQEHEQVQEDYKVERMLYDKQEMADSGLRSCPQCTANTLMIGLEQVRAADEGMTQVEKCMSCGYSRRYRGGS